MLRRLPPLNGLRAFEATGRNGSFTAAAKELNVTQTAVSRMVRLLEERLGFRLFRRHRQRDHCDLLAALGPDTKEIADFRSKGDIQPLSLRSAVLRNRTSQRSSRVSAQARN